MRKTRKGKINRRVMDVIAKHYNTLRARCGYRKYGNFCSKNYEDIFQDTVLYVVQDEKASRLADDAEILDFFCWRFKMIEFQVIHDNAMLKEVEYADYKQTKEESDEED